MFTNTHTNKLCNDLIFYSANPQGKSVDCKHMLHLVPNWQSSSKHIKLKTIMQASPTPLPPHLGTPLAMYIVK